MVRYVALLCMPPSILNFIIFIDINVLQVKWAAGNYGMEIAYSSSTKQKND